MKDFAWALTQMKAGKAVTRENDTAIYVISPRATVSASELGAPLYKIKNKIFGFWEPTPDEILAEDYIPYEEK